MKPLIAAMILVGSLACGDGLTLITDDYFENVPISGPNGTEPLHVSWSEYASRERIVVRDAAHWAAVWPEISSDPLPVVDFTTSTVIVAAMGAQPTGGFSIGFYGGNMSRGSSTVYIDIVETVPGADCVVTQSVTRPAAVALIPRRPEHIQFFETSVVRTCK